MRSLRFSTSARSRAAHVTVARSRAVATVGGSLLVGLLGLAVAPAASAATDTHSPTSYEKAAHAPATRSTSTLISGADKVRIAHWSATLRRIRTCEASGNYRIDTGNGYYGAYQFAAATWHNLGYRGLPNQAAPIVQDAAAAKLLSAEGTSPWGACA